MTQTPPSDGLPENLPATYPYVRRLLAAFKAQDSEDPLAMILIDYGKASQEALTAIAASAVPEGWKLVPVELTPKMSLAFHQAWRRHSLDWAYAEMLKAAPKAPEET